MSIILGIDPGSRKTGFGLIVSEQQGNKNVLQYIASGCIKVMHEDFSERLLQIFEGIHEVIRAYKPNASAIEQVFMFNNPASALKLGQARGVAMVALSTGGLPVSEYSARQVKQSVVGKGGASKTQVAHMVQTILKIEGTLQEDAADALAIAICHHHTHSGLLALGVGKKIVRHRIRN